MWTTWSGMNEREAEKFVKKDNIWKKPDYEAMLEDGDSLSAWSTSSRRRGTAWGPPQEYKYRRDDTPELRRARQEEYIETVRELQCVVADSPHRGGRHAGL